MSVYEYVPSQKESWYKLGAGAGTAEVQGSERGSLFPTTRTTLSPTLLIKSLFHFEKSHVLHPRSFQYPKRVKA